MTGLTFSTLGSETFATLTGFSFATLIGFSFATLTGLTFSTLGSLTLATLIGFSFATLTGLTFSTLGFDIFLASELLKSEAIVSESNTSDSFDFCAIVFVLSRLNKFLNQLTRVVSFCFGTFATLAGFVF